MTKNQWIADGLLLAAAIIWGSAFAVVKNTLDSVPPSMMIALRFGIAALISGVILRKHLRGLTRGQVLMGLLVGVLTGLAYIVQTIGLQDTTAGKNAFLTTIYVLLVPFGSAVLFHEKLGARRYVAAVLMLLYIAVRFDFYSGLAAIIGLLHDVAIMLSAVVLLHSFIRVETTFIAALLTIVGYSINNTIIIFDRIRENSHKSTLRQLNRESIVNLSVQESLSRTLNTTITTLLTIVTLYIMGVDSIKQFALPLIIGIVAGTYSANLINGYVWAALMDKRDASKRAKAKA